MVESPLRSTERWFYRRGLPFLVEDYRSSTNVWTRASPFLAFMFVVIVLGAAASFDDALGAVMGVVITVVIFTAYALWNRARGRRLLAVPERVTWPVLSAFVLVPGVVTVVSSRTWENTIDTVVFALIVLGLAWVLTRYAIVALCGWAIRYTVRGFSDLYRLTTRALPVLLLFIVFLFLNTEVWQVAGGLKTGHLWVVIALFIVFGIVFVVGRVPEEIRLIEAATTREQVIQACARTPLADVVPSLPDLDTPVSLNRRQKANIGLVMTVAQLVQVALFAIVVWLFLVLFGALAVSVSLQGIWMDGAAPIDVLWDSGQGYGVTRQLLRVSLFLAAFSGFYVTIYTTIDASYREHFYDRVRADLERSLSVRRAYVLLYRRG